MSLTLLVLFCSGCSDSSGPTEPGPEPARQTRIVFESQRDGNPEIYVMNADGTDQKRLTFNVAHDLQPSWSRDGSRIVFVRKWQDGNGQSWNGLYSMRADGSQPFCFDSAAGHFYSNPRYSPDAGKVAFTRSGSDGKGDIWIIDAGGYVATNITNSPENEREPDWSPDGTLILHVRDTTGSRIYTMKPDGSDTLKVLETGIPYSNQIQPRWSPDGKMIAYADDKASWQSGTGWDYLHVVNSDGSNPRTLITLDGSRVEPSWSPDGSRIAYRFGTDIFTVTPDGQASQNVTNSPAYYNITPDWGPAEP